MQILILGSKGFIGSHLVDYFSITDEITCCDYKEISNPDRRCFQAPRSLEAFNTFLTQLFTEHNFDWCIDAAGSGHVGLSVQRPFYDFYQNTVGTAQILEAIRLYQPTCQYLNLSSAAVYGNPSSLPVSEEHSVSPVSPYGWHKHYSELICQEYSQLYKLTTYSVRMFSVYGERLKKQIFWDLYQKARVSPVIQLFGTGKETRDFIHIEDVVQAVSLIISQPIHVGGAINLACGQEITIEVASQIFIQALNPELQIEFNGEQRRGDPHFWRADISKLEALGFSPRVDFKTGLEQYVKWLKENELV